MSELASDCQGIHEGAAELALGLVVGPERAAALSHLERCEACRTLVGDLTRVVDHLLLVGPRVEPPADFESRVLGRIHALSTESAGSEKPSPGAPVAPVIPIGARRPHRVLMAAAALIVVALAVATGALMRGSGGPSIAAAREASMVTPTGHRVGKVQLGGSPATVFVALPDWYWPDRPTVTYRLRMELSDGSRRDLGPVVLHDGGVWGATTGVEPGTVRSVVLFDASGRELCRARLTSA